MPFDSEGVPGSGFDAAFYASTTMNAPYNNADPSSTYDGTAIWINSGSGPVMLTAAVNADLWVDDYDAIGAPAATAPAAPTAGWRRVGC